MKTPVRFARFAAITLMAALASGPLSAGQAGAPTRKALTFDDFIRIRRVTDPQVSPDGKWVAFTVTVMSEDLNRGLSDIWIVPARGGEPRRLTTSPQADNTPRWSPDSRRIAFVSSRTGKPQIHLISPEGGEATTLTTLSTGASGPAWSPDGRFLLFASSVFPDCPDDACNKARAEAAEANPVKAKIFDSLLVRHWNAWWDGTRSHVFAVPAAGGTPVDLTPGDYDTPPIALGGTQDYVASPDGAEVCFVRNVDPGNRVAISTNNDLFTTPSAGGPIRKITTSPANDHSPRYSPDGRYIAYLAMARPRFEADKVSVMLYDRKAGTAVNLTADLDRSAGELFWAPDSRSLYFDAEDRGRSALFRVAVPGGTPERVVDGRTMGSFTIAPDGRVIYYLQQAMNRPNDIWSLDPATGKTGQVTDFNAPLLATLEMNPAEEFWFAGAGGDRVQGFLVKPPFFDPSKKYPLVMLIHGGPQGIFGDDFHYRWNAEMFAAPGNVVATVNFHGSTSYGQAFTDSIRGDWGGKPFEDIMKGLAYVRATYPFVDPERTGAAGASYGGYMIDWIEGHTTEFDCLVSHDGVFDLRSEWGATEELWFPEWEYLGTPWTSPEQYAKWSPSYYIQNFKTPCLVVHGGNDFRVPLEQGLQLFTALQRMSVPSKFLYFPDEDHFVQKPLNARLWWKTVLDWLGMYSK